MSGGMKLHLERHPGFDERRPPFSEKPAPPSPRSAKRRLTFVTLAGVLAIVGALVAGYYFAMRPVTLRIAVGPANSDDLKVVQNLTQAFNNQRNSVVRLRPVQTDGAVASARLLGEGKADLAIIRGDLDVPKNAQAVATLRRRRGAVGATRGQDQGQEGRAHDHENRPARRTSHRRRRPHRGQRQSAQGDPAAIRRRSGKGRDHPVPRQRGGRGDPSPEGRRLSRRRSGQQQDHDGRDRGLRATAARRHSSRSIRRRRLRRPSRYEASEIPAARLRRAGPARGRVKTISFSHHIVARRGMPESTIAIFTGSCLRSARR